MYFWLAKLAPLVMFQKYMSSVQFQQREISPQNLLNGLI